MPFEWKEDRLGAVIVFEPHVTREQAEAVLHDMRKAGLIGKSYDWKHGEGMVEASGVHGFDSRCGGPVWYIP